MDEQAERNAPSMSNEGSNVERASKWTFFVMAIFVGSLLFFGSVLGGAWIEHKLGAQGHSANSIVSNESEP
jgi:hypothetical protein